MDDVAVTVGDNVWVRVSLGVDDWDEVCDCVCVLVCICDRVTDCEDVEVTEAVWV